VGPSQHSQKQAPPATTGQGSESEPSKTSSEAGNVPAAGPSQQPQKQAPPATTGPGSASPGEEQITGPPAPPGGGGAEGPESVEAPALVPHVESFGEAVQASLKASAVALGVDLLAQYVDNKITEERVEEDNLRISDEIRLQLPALYSSLLELQSTNPEAKGYARVTFLQFWTTSTNTLSGDVEQMTFVAYSGSRLQPVTFTDKPVTQQTVTVPLTPGWVQFVTAGNHVDALETTYTIDLGQFSHTQLKTHLERRISTAASDEADDLKERLGRVEGLIQQDIKREKDAADARERARQALEKAERDRKKRAMEAAEAQAAQPPHEVEVKMNSQFELVPAPQPASQSVAGFFGLPAHYFDDVAAASAYADVLEARRDWLVERAEKLREMNPDSKKYKKLYAEYDKWRTIWKFNLPIAITNYGYLEPLRLKALANWLRDEGHVLDEVYEPE
jgi:hypothetical protein